MIFFSDDISNEIIDNCKLDEIFNKLTEFKNDVKMIFTYFNYSVISIDYINNLLNYESNKTAFYCIDNNFDIRNCPSCMIYSKQNIKGTDEIIYYIFVISTQRRFRKLGYATMLLDGFVERIKNETINSNKKVKIVLSSLDEVVSYYQNYGFEVVDYSFENYPYLQFFEKCDDKNIYTVMEFNIR